MKKHAPIVLMASILMFTTYHVSASAGAAGYQAPPSTQEQPAEIPNTKHYSGKHI